MNTQATSLFALGGDELDSRKSFLKLTESDFNVLKELEPFALSISLEVAKEFCDIQFGDEALFHYFESVAKQKKMNLTDFRAHLEQAHAECFLRLFTGVEGEWGKKYFEQCLFGAEGDTQIPLKWYIAASAHYEKIVITKIAKKYWYRPLFVKKASEAFMKLVNLDIQMVVDHYTEPFTKVMSEIQTASEHTAGATQKMQQIIAEQSNRLTEHSSEVSKVEANIENLYTRLGQVEEMSQQLGETLRTAVSVMQDIQEKVFALSESIHEQKLASERTRDAVKQMEGISGQFITSTQQSLDSALEIDKEMDHLRSVVRDFH